jgi:hypothetical protein
MAGLERVSCSMPAVLCVYRRPLVASSTRAEAKTVEARARAVWGSFYLGLYIIVRTAATYAWTTPSLGSGVAWRSGDETLRYLL